ncbi:MAG: hypothetical protein ACYCTV_05925 [Leptospirales bacterium]
MGPGTTYSSSTYSGFLVVCALSNLSCTITTLSNISIPSGNIAFTGSGASEQIFIGNYDASSIDGYFASCTVSFNPSCSLSSIAQHGPIALTSNGNNLYIAATVTAIDSAYSSATNTSSSGSGSPPSTGYIFSCSFSLASSCSSNQPTGGWPVGITIDPTGNFMFVPTLSGMVNVFQGISSGSLSSVTASPLSIPGGLTPISVSTH